jgi:hypothetical protein
MGTDTSSVIPMLRVQSKRNLKALVKSLGSEVLTFEPIHLAHPHCRRVVYIHVRLS